MHYFTVKLLLLFSYLLFFLSSSDALDAYRRFERGQSSCIVSSSPPLSPSSALLPLFSNPFPSPFYRLFSFKSFFSSLYSGFPHCCLSILSSHQDPLCTSTYSGYYSLPFVFFLPPHDAPPSNKVYVLKDSPIYFLLPFINCEGRSGLKRLLQKL